MRDLLSIIEQAGAVQTTQASNYRDALRGLSESKAKADCEKDEDCDEDALLESILAEGNAGGRGGLFMKLAAALGAVAVGALLGELGMIDDVVHAFVGGDTGYGSMATPTGPGSLDLPGTNVNPYGNYDFGDEFDPTTR